MDKKFLGVIPLIAATLATILTGCGSAEAEESPEEVSLFAPRAVATMPQSSKTNQSMVAKRAVVTEGNNKDLPVADEYVAKNLSSSGVNSSELHRFTGEHDLKLRVISKNVHHVYAPILPTQTPTGGLLLEGEYLYWQPVEDGLDYAMRRFYDVNGSQTAEKISYKQDWDSGFRVGLGIQFEKDQQQMHLRWTRFHSDSKSHASVSDENFGPDENLLPLWASDFLGVDSKLARAHTAIKHDMVDLEFGRQFFVSKNFNLRSHFGLRGGRIDQNYEANYENVFFTTTFLGIEETRMKGHNQWRGIGVRTGLDGLFHFNEGIGIFGKASGSLLAGRFDVHQRFDSEFAQSPLSFDYKNHFHRIRPNIEGAIGLQFSFNFSNHKYVNLLVGYEAQYWWNQNQMVRDETVDFSSAKPLQVSNINGDLVYHGLTARAEIKF